jgi:GT2 family glycosyltransferase
LQPDPAGAITETPHCIDTSGARSPCVVAAAGLRILMPADSATTTRVTAAGRFLYLGGDLFPVKGISYGMRSAEATAAPLACSRRLRDDFQSIARAGANTVRLYGAPTTDVLDEASRHDLRIFSGVPQWQDSVLLEDRRSRQSIRRLIAESVRTVAAHPASLLIALGNEIPPPLVRWLGARRLEQFLRELYDEAKNAAPEALLTYVNFPPTEPLSLPFFDVCSFSVHLRRPLELRAYFARLQHIAGHRPFLLAEAGCDSLHGGEEAQAVVASMQLRTAFAEGACGAVAFTWNDGHEDTGRFGLVDVSGRPKLALHTVSRVFAEAPFPDTQRQEWPKVSVVVCAYNAASTIDECLTSLERLTYPSFEVILVNDGSTDATASIARRHREVKIIDLPNCGLSAARNVGLSQATGDIVAYTDADVRVDPNWLTYLVQPFITSDVVGSGGPNVVPPDDPWIAQSVARSPGGPTHVLLDDRIAEHVPGCNMAFRRDALLEIGGFNPIFRRAGDDVDLCWRLQAKGYRIGFAPSALVWHRHRARVRAYWRQQVGYGESETWLMSHHPEKFPNGRALWHGRIYSPLPYIQSISGTRVHAGLWGTAEFPSVYRTDAHPVSFLPHLARWQMLSCALLVASAALSRFAVGGLAIACLAAGVMGLSATVWRCFAFAMRSDINGLPAIGRFGRRGSRGIYRVTMAWLHALQPLARAWGRIRGTLSPPPEGADSFVPVEPRHVDGPAVMWTGLRLLLGRSVRAQFWSDRHLVRPELLGAITERLRASRVGPHIDIDDGWRSDHDICVAAARWVSLGMRGLVEAQGAGRRVFRVAFRLRTKRLVRAAAIVVLALPLVFAAVRLPGLTLLTLVLDAFGVGWCAYRVGQTEAAIRRAIDAVVSVVRAPALVRPAFYAHDRAFSEAVVPSVAFRAEGLGRRMAALKTPDDESSRWAPIQAARRFRLLPRTGTREN